MNLLLILVVARMMSSHIDADKGGLLLELMRGHTVSISLTLARKLLNMQANKDECSTFMEGSPSIVQSSSTDPVSGKEI